MLRNAPKGGSQNLSQLSAQYTPSRVTPVRRMTGPGTARQSEEYLATNPHQQFDNYPEMKKPHRRDSSASSYRDLQEDIEKFMNASEIEENGIPPQTDNYQEFNNEFQQPNFPIF
jgi:hypothetical protein